MRKTTLAIAMAIAIMTGTSGTASAAAYYISDGIDTEIGWGKPSTAQREQTDLRKISYWFSNGRIYVRWQVTNLRTGYKKPNVYMEGRYQNYSIGATSEGRSFVLWPDGVHEWGYASYDYTANTVTASFPRTEFPKGVRWYPHGRAQYMNTDQTVYVFDRRTPEGQSIIVNP